MISLGQIARMIEDKQDRIEYREKALGEKQKMILNVLEKRLKPLEPLNGLIVRLDERLSNVETLLVNKCHSTGTTDKATHEISDDIHTSKNNLTSSDDTMDRRLNMTDTKIDAVKMQIEDLNKSLSEKTLRATCMNMPDKDNNPLKRHLSEADKLLSKYELKLNEYNSTVSEAQITSASLDKVLLAEETWHSSITGVLTRQETGIKKIEQLLSDAESMWKDLPRKADLHLATNQTLDAIVNATENIKENDEKLESNFTTILGEKSGRLLASNKDIQRRLTQGKTTSERAYNDIFEGYDSLRMEIQMLVKSQHILPVIADYVIATNTRIQHGVHQILMEMREGTKIESKSNIAEREKELVDSTETTIARNQTISLSDLTANIESDRSLVRQIGIMHQQINTYKQALDTLTDQTQQYIINSSAVMKNLKDLIDILSTQNDTNLESGSNMSSMLGGLSLESRQHLGNYLSTLLGHDGVTESKQNTTLSETTPSIHLEGSALDGEAKMFNLTQIQLDTGEK